MLLRVLVCTDRAPLERRLSTVMASPDVALATVRGRKHLWQKLSHGSYDLVILTGRILGPAPGELTHLVRSLPEVPEVVVLLEGDDPTERARLLAAGCLITLSDELADPLLKDALLAVAARRRANLERLASSRSPGVAHLGQFVSASPAMRAFLDVVRRVAKSDATLLILGETGVGKEWLARAIHSEGPRAEGRFVAVNCGALPETLLESELFGHEEGAFTGATRVRRGMFELAHGGTIFLDEIGELPLHLQVKLLRVLQAREVQRVGSEQLLCVNVRVMAATNRDLEEEVEEGRFRRDLFYRLGVVTLAMPPLRERPEDIPDLAASFIDHFQAQLPSPVEGLSPQVLEALKGYTWPGNVRELMNVVERAILLAEGERIELEDLPQSICQSPRPGLLPPADSPVREGSPLSEWLAQPLKEARAAFERAYLQGQLVRTGGRVGEAAALAGISERTLYEKMKALGLRKEDFRPPC